MRYVALGILLLTVAVGAQVPGGEIKPTPGSILEAKVAQPEAKRPEPTLTVEQSQTLDLAVAKIENLELKIKLLEVERDAVRNAAQQYLTSLHVEGYSLVRTQEGKWVFQKVQKK